MLLINKLYYSIGEVAKITNVSIQTLRYYDKIGIFKPAYIDPENNYRYYKDGQLFYLDIIKSLKFIGTSLEDIKQALTLTPEQLLHFLEGQEQVIDQRLQQLEEIKLTLLTTKKQMREQIEIKKHGVVYIKQSDEVRILKIKCVDSTPAYVSSSYYSVLTKILENKGSINNGRYGCSYALKHYSSLSDIQYDYIFNPLLTERDLSPLPEEVEITTMPAGKYACIAFLFSIDTYFEHYQKLLRYIKENDLTTSQEVFEIFMPNNFTPDEQEEFVVELKVLLI